MELVCQVVMIEVSTRQEVLERLRQYLEGQLVAYGYQIQPADTRDIHHAVLQVFRAWVRVRHRSVPQRPRRVHWSNELTQRSLEASVRYDIGGIEKEFENGVDLNPRLTRNFFKAGFNDFLFNHFKLQHIHLGEPNTDL